MTDELELLKRDWQKKKEHLPKLSYNEIYDMLWKKSSTIVKWLFYISISELIIWIILSVIPFISTSYQVTFNQTYGDDFDSFFIGITVFSLSIVVVFIYFLFKAYRNISVVDDIKSLMKSILKTRKIVHYYVVYNLIMAVLVTLYTSYLLFTTDEKTIQLINSIKEDGSEFRFWVIMVLIVTAGILLMVGIIWLFYRLIYGILLKRLNQNYKELKQIEV